MNFKTILVLAIIVSLFSLGLIIMISKFIGGRSRIFSNIYYAGVRDKYRALDIYTPNPKGKYPVIFFVHGGAWSVGDKKDHTFKGLFFSKKDYVFVNVNYRLAPNYTYPVFVYDVAQALSWVYNHIEEYGGDKSKIYLMGHSAGGHLIALVSFDSRFLGKYGLDTSIIKGLILLDGGGYDIPYIHDNFPVSYKLLFKQAFGEDINIMREASPIYYLKRGKYIPPILIIYTNWRLTKTDAQRLINMLNSIDALYNVYYAENKTHDTVSKDIGKPGDKTTEKILEFLKT